jgi:hypothetical protein
MAKRANAKVTRMKDIARPDGLEDRRDDESDPLGEGRRLVPRLAGRQDALVPAGHERPDLEGLPWRHPSKAPMDLLPDDTAEVIGNQLQLTLVELIALSLARKAAALERRRARVPQRASTLRPAGR